MSVICAFATRGFGNRVAHDLTDLFAELDDAKADLQRRVRHSRAFLAGRVPRPAATDETRQPAAFGWERPEPD